MNADTRINGLNLLYVVTVITACLIGVCFIVGNTSATATPAPVTGTVPATDTATEPADAPVTDLAPPAEAPTDADSSGVYYANCDEVIAANAAPIYLGDPGWDPAFDADQNGIGCE